MMKKISRFNDQGFTLIELLIVILILAILAIIGLTQYVNYTIDAKNSTTKSNLQILRRGITTANAYMRTRCAYNGTDWPNSTAVISNDITAGTSPCSAGEVPVLSDRKFFGSAIPANPWSHDPNNIANVGTNPVVNQANFIDDATGVTDRTLDCTDGSARDGNTVSEAGWCYNTDSGEVWANSADNNGDDDGAGNEYTY